MVTYAINYFTKYYQWKGAHKTELKNLNNMNYWRSLKNEEERNLPSHPNRSPNHIPTRILNIREDLILTHLTYLFGEEEWKKNRYSNDLNCRSCGVHMQDLSDYLSQIIKTFDTLFNWRNDKEKDFQPALNKALDLWDQDYPELVKEKARLNLPRYGSRTLLTHKYGWCPVCWEDIIMPQLGWDDRLE